MDMFDTIAEHTGNTRSEVLAMYDDLHDRGELTSGMAASQKWPILAGALHDIKRIKGTLHEMAKELRERDARRAEIEGQQRLTM